MPLNSAGFNVSGFNTPPQASGGGGSAAQTVASATLPSLTASSNVINHVDIKTYTNVIGKAVSGLALIGGAAPAVDTATTLPNQIAKYTSFPDARVGYAVTGYAKPTGTVVAGSVISSNGVMPSLTAGGVYLAAGKGYSNTVLPAVSAKAYGAANAAISIPSVTAAAVISIVTHLDASVSTPKPTTSGILLVGNNITSISNARVVVSATGYFPAVATANAIVPRFTTIAGALVDNNLSSSASLPAVSAKAYGAANATNTVPSVHAAANTTSGNVASSQVSITVSSSSSLSVGSFIAADAKLRLLVKAGATRGLVSTSAPATIHIESQSTASSGNLLSSASSLGVVSAATMLVGNTMTGSGSVRYAVEAYAHTVSGTTVWKCVNLHTGAVTDWDYQADYISSHRNITAVIQLGGVATMGGDTDSGMAINYKAVSGLDDLGTSHLKRIPDVWLGGRNLAKVTLTTDDSIRRELTGGLHLVGATERRVKVPRGIKTRYVQIGVFGEAPASLDALSVEPEVLSRRVR